MLISLIMQIAQSTQISIRHFLNPQTMHITFPLKNLAVKNISGLTHCRYRSGKWTIRTGRLLNVCVQEGRIPKEWRMGLIVPIWKRTGDVHNPGNYRGITLLSHVLKLLERVLDARIRRRVECDFGEKSKGSGRGEEQQTGCTS